MQPDTRLPHARVTGQLDQGSELSKVMTRLTQEDLRRGLTAAIHDRPISDSHMTDPEASSSSVVRFDVFEVDLQAGELRRDSRKIKLQEQPFRVLSSVLERPGELVTRKELCQKLWPANTFVDFDHGLNSAVARLRDALSDSAEQPKFIETVPKRGYRFIASLIHHPVPVLPFSENFPPTRLQKLQCIQDLGCYRGRGLYVDAGVRDRAGAVSFENAADRRSRNFFAEAGASQRSGLLSGWEAGGVPSKRG